MERPLDLLNGLAAKHDIRQQLQADVDDMHDMWWTGVVWRKGVAMEKRIACDPRGSEAVAIATVSRLCQATMGMHR